MVDKTILKFEDVREVITDRLGVEDEVVVPGAHFADDLGADSLDRVEMLMSFEEKYDIQISDEDGEKIKTVQQLMDYLRKRLEQ